MKKVLGLAVLLLLLAGCGANIKDGVALLEEGKYEDALKAFSKDVDKERNLDEAYRGIGIAYFEMENYVSAIEAFELALEHGAEETATIGSFLGASYLEIGDYDKSLDYYERALGNDKITKELEQEIQFQLIAVYENMGNWDAAEKQMKKYTKAYPDDTRVEKEAEFLETR